MFDFAESIIKWQKRHGRNNLPWQKPITAYRVWISEIMLQQTQVTTVIEYFNRFITRFPDIHTLAEASEDEVLAMWSGLGYYRRARHLHQTSQIIAKEHQGIVPTTPNALYDLPGIGKSTAHAIASIAGGYPYAILDANVKRVLQRFHAIDEPANTQRVKNQLWEKAQLHMPKKRCQVYTQGMMDLGANICTQKPKCMDCPIQIHCKAQKLGLQSSIPKKIKKPSKPVKKGYFICFIHKNRVFFTKRPSNGIWPKLWCFPDYKEYEDITVYDHEELPVFRHSFTHFHLDFHTFIVRTKPIELHAQGIWLGIYDFSNIGLPSAISKVLKKNIMPLLKKDCRIS